VNRQTAVSTAVILAGGENRRFRGLKSFMNIEGTPVIARNLALLKELFQEVFISTNSPGPYFHLGATLIGDVVPSRGPMAGIYSALLNAKGPGIFVAACDMPFLSKKVINLICETYLRSCRDCGPCDAVVPVFGNEPQPLLGIYSRDLIPHMEKLIALEKTSVNALLREVRTCFVREPDIRMLDPTGRSFVNINTVEEYNSVKGEM
jgi:molybdopterin-guanine dinucleotide biosynthesis protein A